MQHSIPTAKKWMLVLLSFILIITMSACNAFSPSQTTFIIDYPPPRITNFYIDGTTLNGEIAITLNPSINNDLSEYWLVLASNSSATGFPNTLGAIIDTTSLDITPEDAISNFYTNLPEVTRVFSSITVNNYSFTNLALPSNTNHSTQDFFYKLAVRAWGSNDSFALANQHSGWIVSPLSETLTFYLGYETNLCLTPGVNHANGIGYRHIVGNPPTINPNPDANTQIPCASSGNPPTYDNGTSSYIEVATNSLTDPEVIFYTQTNPLTMEPEIGIGVSQPNIRLVPTTLERLGDIFNLSDLTGEDGITHTQELGFPIQENSIFLIEHLAGQRYSKLQIESFTDNTIQIRVLYTGTNSANLTQF